MRDARSIPGWSAAEAVVGEPLGRDLGLGETLGLHLELSSVRPSVSRAALTSSSTAVTSGVAFSTLISGITASLGTMFMSSSSAVRSFSVIAASVENRLPQLMALALSASTIGGPISSGTNSANSAP